MGNWIIHIEGHGIHDNGVENDADSLARDFAGQLVNAGHHVSAVSFTSGYTKVLPTSATGSVHAVPEDYLPGDDRHLLRHHAVHATEGVAAGPADDNAVH